MHALTLLVPAPLVEAASDALVFELDALSVTVEDADAGGDDEQPLFGEPDMPAPAAGWTRSRMVALYPTEAAAHEAAQALLAQSSFQTVEYSGLQAIPNTDWVRLTQAQFEPVAITPSFWVVPTWHEAPPAATQIIRLDPGLAFGSGTHPTTRMCLRWLAASLPQIAQQQPAARVLDYGCGSGILAIAAAQGGALQVDAVDIDEAAVTATQDNARANHVRVHAGQPPLAQGPYDVVLANILATPLTVLAPLLANLVGPGGHLVLAGLLTRQSDALTAAYAPWLPLTVCDSMDGWVLLSGQRERSV
jgi:ribosomal protein L11 methyltransferase